jgi:hypothetical protein
MKGQSIFRQWQRVMLTRKVISENPRNISACDARQGRVVGLQHLPSGFVEDYVAGLLGKLQRQICELSFGQTFERQIDTLPLREALTGRDDQTCYPHRRHVQLRVRHRMQGACNQAVKVGRHSKKPKIDAGQTDAFAA